jgi:hypothetical protein
MQVVIHMCMEAMLGISLHRTLCEITKNAMSFILSLLFSQNWRRWQNRFCLKVRGKWRGGEK